MAAIPPSALWSPPTDLAHAETIGKAHGRIETRTLQATMSLAAYLSPTWPGLAQVCRITRRRIVRGQHSAETVYAITSLTPDKADAAQLLALSRAHWGIENNLHWTLDVTFREDDSRVRDRTATRNLALLRKIALNIVGRDRTSKVSIRARRKKAAWNDSYMLQLLVG